MVDASMVTIIASPYAASMADDFLKYKTMAVQPAKSIRLIPGMYSWPFSSDGYRIFIFAHRVRRIAALVGVKAPDIMAWLAMIAAVVAMMTPGMISHSGIRS